MTLALKLKEALTKIEDTSANYWETSKSESVFQSAVKGILGDLGFKVVKVPSSTEKGLVLPDLLCMVPNTLKGNSLYTGPAYFFIEMKKPKGRGSKIQKVTFKHLNENYTRVFWVHDWGDLTKLIEETFAFN